MVNVIIGRTGPVSAQTPRGLFAPSLNSTAISIFERIEESDGSAPVARRGIPVRPQASVAGLGRDRHQPVMVDLAPAIDMLEPAVVVRSAADPHRRGAFPAEVAAVRLTLEEAPRINAAVHRLPILGLELQG
jgi:hypothetical protein